MRHSSAAVANPQTMTMSSRYLVNASITTVLAYPSNSEVSPTITTLKLMDIDAFERDWKDSRMPNDKA